MYRMTPEHITLLTTNKNDIHFSFNKFKGIRPFCGVYAKEIGGVFVTFGTNSSFAATQRIGHNLMDFVCFFDCSQDFDTQFAAKVQ